MVFREILADQLDELFTYVRFHCLVVGGIVPDNFPLLFHLLVICILHLGPWAFYMLGGSFGRILSWLSGRLPWQH